MIDRRPDDASAGPPGTASPASRDPAPAARPKPRRFRRPAVAPFWMRALVWVLVLLAGIGILTILGATALPFIAGAAFAFMFDPIVGWLERRGVRRAIAAFLVTGGVTGIIVAGIALLLPVLAEQASGFLDRLPELLGELRYRLGMMGAPMAERIPETETDFFREAARRSAEWLRDSGANLLGFAVNLFHIGLLVVLTPVITFYLLRDWNRVVEKAKQLLPRQSRPTVVQLVAEMTDRLAGMLRGLMLSAFIQAVIHAVGLVLLGLNFGILIGVLTGLLVFVPVIGNLSMFLVALAVAIVQFDEWWRIAAVVALFAGTNMLESSVLEPVLVGNRTNLHPVWVIFALLVGGSLFGLIGAFLALPVATVIAVLVRFVVHQYMASRTHDEI